MLSEISNPRTVAYKSVSSESEAVLAVYLISNTFILFADVTEVIRNW